MDDCSKKFEIWQNDYFKRQDILKKEEIEKRKIEDITKKEKSRIYRKKYKNTPEYKSKNREYNRIYLSVYIKSRRASDINFNLANRLRCRVRAALKFNYKSGSAVGDLGCTVPELKIYLESKFTEGMTWSNHSNGGWHIDHIIPLTSFNLSIREQFLKACHYSNLQPLWAKDNHKKYNKIPS